ncbi:peptidase [Seminavis robusta]|uniref:Peptidase n=1 Tax=Seminavis robusta TaxID=568900 RepID=A0A9N8H3F8_9STRA|nr:peptidase [Seminavis robusta]|eukprot:Sro86_g045630.1 peptidase (349) ;mRNA; r:33468-34514
MMQWVHVLLSLVSSLLLLTGSTTNAFSTPAVTTTTTKSTDRLTFPNLDASLFRHPLDRNLTGLVTKLPGIQIAEQGIRRTFPLVEQTVRLDLLSSAVKVSPQQLPHIYDLLVEACEILDLTDTHNNCSIPELYVQSNTQANAYTLAWQGSSTPILVVTSALLDRCTPAELQAVIGHELGHVKCEHSLYLTLGGLASAPLRTLPFAGQKIDQALTQWRLAAEYTCDRAALMVAQDVHVVQSALLKLVSGTSNVNVQEFVQQCQEYNTLLKSANPLVRASIRRQVRTHPLPVRRVAKLQEWAQSDEYNQLLRENGVAIVKMKTGEEPKETQLATEEEEEQDQEAKEDLDQ